VDWRPGSSGRAGTCFATVKLWVHIPFPPNNTKQKTTSVYCGLLVVQPAFEESTSLNNLSIPSIQHRINTWYIEYFLMNGCINESMSE
jgi:hypothetical protein